MAIDFKAYLATTVISDQRTVTYRLLSRQLKCHNNAAKRMLFDFYKRENAKKAGSIHATYLVSGVRQAVEMPSTSPSQNGTSGNMDVDSDVPPSSPPMSSSMPAASQDNGGCVENVSVLTVTLVREEELAEIKKAFQSISSIQIYSLEPAPLQNLNILTGCSQELFDEFFVKKDPLEYNSQYGVIQNRGVRRRTNRRPPLPPAPPQSATSKAPPKSIATASSQLSSTQSSAKPGLKQAESQESQPRPSSRGGTDPKPSSTTKSGSLRRDTSDLFKSFAKTNKKPKAVVKQSPSGSSATSLNASRENTPMDDNLSESDGSEDSSLFANASSRSDSKRPSGGRQEREAKLRKMMDDDEDANEPKSPMLNMKPLDKDTSQGSSNTGAASDDETADWSASDHETAGESARKQPVRRRGRRQTMKKRTTKDEDGYLVTREEPVWESFSEDEPAPRPSKPNPITGSSSSKAPVKGVLKREDSGGKEKEKKGLSGAAGKKGGGNIMNFFSKK